MGNFGGLAGKWTNWTRIAEVVFLCAHRKTIWFHCRIIPGMACFSRVTLCVGYICVVPIPRPSLFCSFLRVGGASPFLPGGNSSFFLSLILIVSVLSVGRSLYLRRRKVFLFRWVTLRRGTGRDGSGLEVEREREREHVGAEERLLRELLIGRAPCEIF